MKKFETVFGLLLCVGLCTTSPANLRAQAKGAVVEEIVARVNNSIVTLTDYQKADQSLRDEVSRACQNCPADKISADYKDRQKDLLRDLIDQQLLIERAKDMGINADADLVKR